MEEKKPSKIGYVICVLIIIALAIGLGYACYMIGNLNNQLSQINTTSTNTIDINTTKNNSTSKIDETKDWVYDAEYERNVNAESFKLTDLVDEEYFVKDIVVPYININSDDARSANNEIKKEFEEAIRSFNEKNPSEWSYKSFINNDILSVIISHKGLIELNPTIYHSYNFDLKTGKKLNFEEVCKVVGYDSNNVFLKAEEKISKYLKDNYYQNGDNEGSEWSFAKMNSESELNFEEAVTNETLKFFIGDNNKLNIVVWLRAPVQLMEHNVIIEID